MPQTEQRTGDVGGPLIDVDLAAAYAHAARDQVFGRNFYELLVAAIPDYDAHERHELISRLNFRALRSRVGQLRAPAALGRWLRHQASRDEAMGVAWGLCNIIGQIEECRLNGGEEDFLARYKDIVAHPHPVQICLFGLDYLIFCYEW